MLYPERQMIFSLGHILYSADGIRNDDRFCLSMDCSDAQPISLVLENGGQLAKPDSVLQRLLLKKRE